MTNGTTAGFMQRTAEMTTRSVVAVLASAAFLFGSTALYADPGNGKGNPMAIRAIRADMAIKATNPRTTSRAGGMTALKSMSAVFA